MDFAYFPPPSFLPSPPHLLSPQWERQTLSGGISMDYGQLMFDEPEAAESALPAPDFDFYGAFLQTQGDVMGAVPQQQQQQQQQQPQQPQQQQQQHHQQHQQQPRRHPGVPSPGNIGGNGVSSHSHGGFNVVDQEMAFAAPHAFHLASSASSTPAAASASTMLTRGSVSTASTTPGRLSPMSMIPGSGTPGKATMVLASNHRPHRPHQQQQQQQQQQHHHHMQGNLSGNEGASSSSYSKRLERRGHTKSRRGCFNCKRRRIKCQETRPACGHCLKTGLQCEYPVAPLVNHQPQHQIPLFSLQDMRFFQHFLLHCSPHHPLGNHSLWTHEIPCLSHSYDYLMHALLGMAASDLMQNDPSLVTAAMDHRLKAIRAIKRTLAAVPKWPNAGLQQPSSQLGGDRSGSGSASPRSTGGESGGKAGGVRRRSGSSSAETGDMHGGSSAPGTPMFEEGNALMATCFALTFQSVALDDGMAEYMTFIRGIIVVAIQMYLKGARIMFRNLLGNDQTELLRPAIEPMSAIDRRWSMTALSAIQNLAPLCVGDSVATHYHALVVEMAEALLASPMEAYSAMTRHYAWWMQLPHEQFRQIVDLDNQVFVLLATHWIALKQIMTRITSKEEVVSASLSNMDGAEGRSSTLKPVPSIEVEGVKDSDGTMDPGIIRWLKHLNRQVEPEYLAYNKWPMWVESELEQDIHVFGKE